MNIIPLANTKPRSANPHNNVQQTELQNSLVTTSNELPVTTQPKSAAPLIDLNPALENGARLDLTKALRVSRVGTVAADMQALRQRIEQKGGPFAALLAQLQVWLDAVNTESDVIRRCLRSVKPTSSEKEAKEKKEAAQKAEEKISEIRDQAVEKAQTSDDELVASYLGAIQQTCEQAANSTLLIEIITDEKTAKDEKDKITKSESSAQTQAHLDAADTAASAAERSSSRLQYLMEDAAPENARAFIIQAQNAAENARAHANEARELASSITNILESRLDLPSLKPALAAIKAFAKSIQTHKDAFLDSPKGSKKNEYHRSLMIASGSRARLAASTIQSLARRDLSNLQLIDLNRNIQLWLRALNQELHEALQNFADRNDEKAAEKIKEQLNPDNSLPKAAAPEDENSQKDIEEYSPILKGLLQRDRLRLAEQKTKLDTKPPLSEDMRVIIRQKLACIIEFEKTIKTNNQTLLETRDDGGRKALTTLLGSTKLRAQLAAIKIQSIVDEHLEDLEARDIRNEAQALVARIRTQVADTLKIVADKLAEPEKKTLQEEQQKALKKAKGQLARIQESVIRVHAENTQILQQAANPNFFQIIQNNATAANRAANTARDELNAMEQEVLANPNFTPTGDNEFSVQLISLLEQARVALNRAQASVITAQKIVLAMKRQILTDNRAMAQEKLTSLKKISAKVKEQELREPLLITETKAALDNLKVLMESMRSRSNFIQTRVGNFLTFDPTDDEMQRIHSETHTLAEEINKQIDGILKKAADLLHESTEKKTAQLKPVEVAPPAVDQQEEQPPQLTPGEVQFIRTRLLNHPDALENPAPFEMVKEEFAEMQKAKYEIIDWQRSLTHVEEEAAALRGGSKEEREEYVRKACIESIKYEVEKAKIAADIIHLSSLHNRYNHAINHFNQEAQAELIRLIDRQAVSEKIVATQTALRIVAPEYAPQIHRLETQLARLQDFEQRAEQERNIINQTNSSVAICESTDRALWYAEEAERLLGRMESLGGLFNLLRMENILADARASVQKTRLYAEQARRQAAIRLLTEAEDEKGELYPPKKDDRPDDDPSAGAAGALLTTDEIKDDTYRLATRVQSELKPQKRPKSKPSALKHAFNRMNTSGLDTVSETAANLAEATLGELAGRQSEERPMSVALIQLWQQLCQSLASTLGQLTSGSARVRSYSLSLLSPELAELNRNVKLTLNTELSFSPEETFALNLINWLCSFCHSGSVPMSALQSMTNSTLSPDEIQRFQQMTADEKKAFMAEKNKNKLISCLIQWLLHQTNLRAARVNLDLLCTALEANADLLYELILTEIETKKSAAKSD